MKGKLVTAVMASSLLAAAVPATSFAASGMKLYGHLNMSVDASDGGGPATGSNNYNDRTTRGHIHDFNVSNNHSYIGLKGFNDMSHGFRAIFQVELGLPGGATASPSPENNFKANGSVYLDDTFMGVTNPTWGTFLMVASGESQTTTVQRDYNIFKDSVGDFNSIIDNFPGIFTFATQTNWAPAYISPTYKGVSLQISPTLEGGNNDYTNTYYQGGNQIVGSKGNSQIDNSQLGWAATLNYTHDFSSLSSTLNSNLTFTGVNVPGSTITYPSLGLTPPGSHHVKDVVAEASWSYNPTKTELIGLFERTYGLIYRSAYAVSVKQGLPMDNDFKVSFIHAGNMTGYLPEITSTGGKHTGANEVAVGLTHHFNKKLRVYLDYAITNNQKNAAYWVGSLYHGDSVRPNSTGYDPQSISLGMSLDI